MQDRRALIQALMASLAAPFPAALAAPPQGAAQVRELRREPLNGPLADYEAIWVEVSYAPGASSTMHQHPGPVFGFVLEGLFRFSVKGGPERLLEPGDTFFEPFDAIHQTSANAGDSPVRLGVLMLAKPGEALTKEV